MTCSTLTAHQQEKLQLDVTTIGRARGVRAATDICRDAIVEKGFGWSASWRAEHDSSAPTGTFAGRSSGT